MRYFTLNGSLSIFSPISRQELDEIPNSDDWADRRDYITDEAHRELRLLIAEAFGNQSSDYALGYVSGFNACIERLQELLHGEEPYELVWNKLILLLAEVARHVPAEDAPDADQYPPQTSSLPN